MSTGCGTVFVGTVNVHRSFGLAGVTVLPWAYLIYIDWGMRLDLGMDV
jgi:hypothetical protein